MKSLGVYDAVALHKTLLKLKDAEGMGEKYTNSADAFKEKAKTSFPHSTYFKH